MNNLCAHEEISYSDWVFAIYDAFSQVVLSIWAVMRLTMWKSRLQDWLLQPGDQRLSLFTEERFSPIPRYVLSLSVRPLALVSGVDYDAAALYPVRYGSDFYEPHLTCYVHQPLPSSVS